MFTSFRSRLTLLVGVFTVAVMGLLSIVLGGAMADVQQRDQEASLQSIAQQTSRTLATGLDERMRDVRLVAATPAELRPAIDHPLWQDVLEQLQLDRPELAWIGITDPAGRVVAATHGLLEGADVSERPWFQAGLHEPFTGDVHPAKLLESLLPARPDGETLRFVDFAAPVIDADGRTVGVVGAHAMWSWTADLIDQSHSPRARDRGVETFIIDVNGDVIHQPRRLADAETAPLDPVVPASETPDGGFGVVRWTDGRFLTVSSPLLARSDVTDLGWTIVTRQPVEAASTAADEARRTVLLAAAGASVVIMVLVWVAAGRFSGPLRSLMRSARRIDSGDLDTLIEPIERSSELRQLSTSLNSMTATLLQRERDLETANSDLERRVAQRTEELERANAELDRLAQHDALTGLVNRRAFDHRLAEEYARHRRSGATMTLALLDVDHFKSVNDTYGHPAGDTVLRELAECLRSTCRTTDVIGRYGGEEFVVLFPDTDADEAAVVAERVRAGVERYPMPEGIPHVTVSLGVVTDAELADDLAAIIEIADGALYRAKHSGRNRVVLSSSGRPEIDLDDLSALADTGDHVR